MNPLDVEDVARVYECPFTRSIVEKDAMGPNPSTPLARAIRREMEKRMLARRALQRVVDECLEKHAVLN